MGFLDEFTIELTKKDNVYKPGDKVEGVLKMKVAERVKINGVYLKALGECDINWYINLI